MEKRKNYWHHYGFGMYCVVCNKLDVGGFDTGGNFVDEWRKAKTPENVKGKGLKCRKCYGKT